MTDATSKRAATELDVSLVDQLKWAAAALGLGRVDCDAEGISVAPLPESLAVDGSDKSDGPVSAPLAGHDVQAATALAAHLPCESGAVADWLRQARGEAERSSSGAWEGEPIGDPETIREIAAPLLSPFTIRHGHSRLAGCTLERRPTLRLGRLVEGVDAAGRPTRRVRWRYYAADGSRWDRETIGRRGWDRVRTTQTRLRGSERSSIEAWLAAVAGEERDPVGGDLVDLTVLWCRWAAGKIILQFDSGSTASIAFSGWASDYTRGDLKPPPFRCPRTGLESYHVIALEDGTVTVPEAVARCQLTDRELLLPSLAACQVSGLRVDREHLVTCQASGQLALPDRLVRCQWCDRRVVPRQIQRGRCEQCRNSGPIAAEDPRLDALRERHPRALEEIGNRRGWSGWIDEEVGMIVGGGVIKNRVLVFDPRSGTILRRGTRAGVSRRWKMEVVEERENRATTNPSA